eukprot:668472-Amphidinium_carterae.1
MTPRRTLPKGPATLHVYRERERENNIVGMLGKMSVKLPMPTQFDGRNPQWSGEVKAYLTIHNVHIEDYMDQSANKSIDVIDLRNIQDAYVTEDVHYRDNKFYDEPTEEQADEYEEYNDLNITIRKKRDEISSISQTLNYVL